MGGILLTGASGIEYFYTPYRVGETLWHRDPANYAFGFQDEGGSWRIVYVGETANLRSRMATHGQWPTAQRLGCGHVLVNLNPGGQRVRRVQEQDLIAAYRPALNTQHRAPSRPRVKRMGYYPGR